MDTGIGDTEGDTRLLLVEDNDKLRRALAAWLALAGCRVAQAPDGETALDLLGQETFDVVVADIVMGAVSGIDVLHAARCLETRPAVILLTGHGALGTAIEAVRAGAHDYLLKPCDEDALLASVRAATAQARSERRLREAARVLTGLAPNAPPAAPLATPDMPSAMAPGSSKDGQTDGPVSAANERAVIAIGALIVGPARHEVRFRGAPVDVTPQEYALLRHLAEHAGQVRPYDEIAWAMEGVRLPTSAAKVMLRTHVHNLRRKLDPAYLVVDRGAGYGLVAPHDDPPAEHGGAGPDRRL